MANKKKNPPKETPMQPEVKQGALKRGQSVMAEVKLKPMTHAIIMAGIAIVSWLFLKACLGNQFTNWDDPGYIQDNILIKNLSGDGLAAIFSKPVMGNYHPLTILSYAIEYSMVNLDPWLYFFDNLTLHVADALLVYWLVNLLTRMPVAGVITALLFALHPMHVESVAWVSGRKDVLYVFFYLLSCISYVYYVREAGGNAKWYVAAFILFVFATLAKPVAVVLPLSLFLIDYLEKREWNKKIMIEKIPHLLVALTIGIIAVKVQNAAGAMDMQTVHYSVMERIALGGYALVTYLWRAILPINLCNVYAYPDQVNGSLPIYYYLYPLIALLVIYAAWRYARKNRIVTFGLLFFIVNIVLLLQFVQVGSSILADRYSYMPYLGLFFIAGYYLSDYFVKEKSKKYGRIVAWAATGYMAVLFFMASARCEVWHDTITLWTDAIENDPIKNIGGYNNLGYIYYQKFLNTQDPMEKQVAYDSAYAFLTKAIELHPEYPNPYISLGEMERGAGKYDEARALYFKGLKINPKNPNLHLGLAILYYIRKDMDSAGIWFKKAVDVDPSPQAYGNYANYLSMAGKQDSAMIIYGISIKRAPDMYATYLNRSRLYKEMHRYGEAIDDLDKAIKLNPDVAELYYERSTSYSQAGDRVKALSDVEKAISLGYNRVDNSYYQSLKQGG